MHNNVIPLSCVMCRSMWFGTHLRICRDFRLEKKTFVCCSSSDCLHFITSLMRTNGTNVTLADRRVRREGRGLLRGTVLSLRRHRLIDFSLHHFELHWDLIAYCESLLSPSLLSVFFSFLFSGGGGVNGAHISSVRTPDLCNYCPGLVYPTALQPCLCLSDWSFGGITK